MWKFENGNLWTRLRSRTALPLSAVALIAGGFSPAAAEDHGFKVLYSFADDNDGGLPMAGVIKGSAGNLYGTTFYYNGVSTPGAVFQLAPDGTERVLYHFSGGNDGGYPNSDLIRDAAGNLYGTTPYGGANGDGVVFRLAPDGTETVIHSFSGGGADGGLLMDRKGNFYGVAGGGCCGIVYKLSRHGRETVLYSFTGGTDGAYPGASDRLIRDKAGNLYGTTAEGGIYGEGVVFRLSPDDTETVLYSFRGGSDGGLPGAGVIQDKAGNLYGTTYLGGGTGCGGGCGTVFKLTPDGTETVVHSFCSFANCSDGDFPQTGLIHDSAGNLYGTTSEGGAAGCGYFPGCGTVFKLSPDGTETVLHAFTGGADGSNPNGLSQDTTKETGWLYGTAQNGGTYAGTVFKVRK